MEGNSGANTTKGYRWVLDADIEACFGRIEHTALLDRVRRRAKDTRALALVKAILKSCRHTTWLCLACGATGCGTQRSQTRRSCAGSGSWARRTEGPEVPAPRRCLRVSIDIGSVTMREYDEIVCIADDSPVRHGLGATSAASAGGVLIVPPSCHGPWTCSSSTCRAMVFLENFLWHRVILWLRKLHRWNRHDVRRHHIGNDGRWTRPAADGIELFQPRQGSDYAIPVPRRNEPQPLDHGQPRLMTEALLSVRPPTKPNKPR